MSVFVDTNVLVYAISHDSPSNASARSILESYKEEEGGIWISRQVLRELLKVLLFISERTLYTDKATVLRAIDDCSRIFRIAEDSEFVTDELHRIVSIYDVRSVQIHYANIVATMLIYGIDKVITANVNDFITFKNEIEIVPFEVSN
jgi:predicted nucleic acid-binding protein